MFWRILAGFQKTLTGRSVVMKRLLCLVLALCLSISGLWAGGASESAAGSSSRGTYLSRRGLIIPPDEVHIDSYVASIDYNYPLPTSSILGVSLYCGHRQISIDGQEEVIQIGIQGRKTDFEELQPMNLAFVIDHSGSMADADKLNWVKDAFDIFIEKVRSIDYVSLVIFDDRGKIIFPATKMDSSAKRQHFKQIVHSIRPGGSTNILDGLQLGCLEVLKNLNREYTNRVLFLSDGQDTCGNDHRSILGVAQQFCDQGVTISTIGVGKSFDLDLMVKMAKIGGGSSRFISDREEMEETFGSELDRMAVPLAVNLEMELEFLVEVELLDTWGYENRRSGDTIRYYQRTFHHGDYETILAHVRIQPQHLTGEMDLARFSMLYEDLYGNKYQSGPHTIRANFVDTPFPVSGFSDAMVLRSGTMLHLAQNLKTIGELYYSNRSPQNLQRAFQLASNTKKELANAKMRLDNRGFDDEIRILDNYLETLGQELQFAEAQIHEYMSDVEVKSLTPQRSFQTHLKNLCAELALDLQLKARGVVAVYGFASQGNAAQDVADLVSEMALAQITRINTISLIREQALSSAIRKYGYTLCDLTDTVNAITVGQSLAADYIVTGTVMETANTYIIFSRLLNIASGEVESAAQVIVAK
jgi:TolB-like protein